MADIQRLLVNELKRHLADGGRPRLPAGGDFLWRWFIELGAARTYHAAGPNPITYGDMAAYSALMRIELRPRHIEILRALDNAFLDQVYRKPAGVPDGAKMVPPISARPMTAALFDAMTG